jgi:hypothetical protein
VEACQCGLFAVGKCHKCGQSVCRRHVTTGGDPWAEDRRIEDVPLAGDEIIDRLAQLTVWNTPDSALCILCRNTYLRDHRDLYVKRGDHGLPDLTGDTVFDIAVLAVEEVSHTWKRNCEADKKAFSCELSRRADMLRPHLEVLGPSQFAIAWPTALRATAGTIRWQSVRTGRISAAPTIPTGWTGHLISDRGQWFVPSKWTTRYRGESGGTQWSETWATRWKQENPALAEWKETGVGEILRRTDTMIRRMLGNYT